MFKLTRRQNGRDMATFSLRFDVDGNMAVRILADRAEVRGPLTKGDVDREIRNALYFSGTSPWPYVHENYEEDEWAELLAAATAHLQRLWPDWNVQED